MSPPSTQIDTERLTLRRYGLADAIQYYELGLRNRDHLVRYETDNPIRHLASEADAVTLLAAFAESWDAGVSYCLGIFLKDSGTLIGQIYVGAAMPALPDYAVGYIIDQAHESKGYVTEAVQRVTHWLFDDLGARRIHIECDDTNTRSAAVTRRCGFRQEAHLRENKRNLDGTITGTFVFGLLRDDWLSTMDISKQALLASLPPEWPEDLLPQIQTQVRAANKKLIVLDDDPTGNQTVHGVAVLTDWSVPILTVALREPTPVVYILTNSRSMPLTEAQDLNSRIVRNLKTAQTATGRDFAIISRSDSTLRGHYPGETDVLAQELGGRIDAVLLVPFFAEGGRLTAGDVHYVAQGDALVPAAATEYARDATFGYTHSDLRDWVCEKHAGAIARDDVATISLSDIRSGGPRAVSAKLMTLGAKLGSRTASPETPHTVCIVNAVSYRDLEVVVAGLLQAEAAGKRFLYRTAASFVRVRGGIAPRALLTHADLGLSPGRPRGGLVVVGSHVQTTTRQVQSALALTGIRKIEVSVPSLLDADLREREISRAAGRIEGFIAKGQDALVCTSREVITATAALDSISIGRRTSRALVEIVRRINTRPAWIIAKGGITSSDVATEGLGVRRVEVLGQAVPGVPVWRTGPESRWPNGIFVVFPGNVGDDQAVARMIAVLRQPAAECAS
ncbi:MAG: GNAT family N-acetyltransferase [Anaerolineae bacterium]|nr:GNAT family N-acetyltransferase [Anaerolineae bacterium]